VAKRLTDAQVEHLAARVAAGITKGITMLVTEHERDAKAHAKVPTIRTSWRWRNSHLVVVREAIEDLIRGLEDGG